MPAATLLRSHMHGDATLRFPPLDGQHPQGRLERGGGRNRRRRSSSGESAAVSFPDRVSLELNASCRSQTNGAVKAELQAEAADLRKIQSWMNATVRPLLVSIPPLRGRRFLDPAPAAIPPHPDLFPFSGASIPPWEGCSRRR